jgi:hypothetical protein
MIRVYHEARQRDKVRPRKEAETRLKLLIECSTAHSHAIGSVR